MYKILHIPTAKYVGLSYSYVSCHNQIEETIERDYIFNFKTKVSAMLYLFGFNYCYDDGATVQIYGRRSVANNKYKEIKTHEFEILGNNRIKIHKIVTRTIKPYNIKRRLRSIYKRFRHDV